MNIVYFSSVSENTKRFVEKLQLPSQRIPLRETDGSLTVSDEFVLVLPTYGGGREKATVPKQVIKFLNLEENRSKMVGVVGTGNTNFFEHYCRAADIVSVKCGVPVLGRVELMGTPEDVEEIKEKILDYGN